MKKKTQLEIKYVAPSTLVPFIGNPRQNEQAVEPVKKSIEHFGFINPIIARRSDNMIIAGHARWKAALKDNLKEVPVVFVDMTENDAKLYNLADNKLAELAQWDIPGLDAILAELQALDIDVSIAGFGSFPGEPDDPNAEYQGMPEFEQEDLSPFKQLKINFASQKDIDTFAELIGQKITEKTRSIWYPKAEKLSMDKVYVDES